MLRDVRIDERTWVEATEARRMEWRAAIAEFIHSAASCVRHDADTLVITVTEQATILDLLREGAVLDHVAIPRDALLESMTEYVDIVRQIGREDGPGGLSRLEALDMAKKVTHDRAGRALRRHCTHFEMDLPTARRLFTLLLSLRIDTTRLLGAHGHRNVK